MALINSARLNLRFLNGANRFKMVFGGSAKEVSIIKRAFTTSMKRKSGVDNWTYRRQNPRPAKGSMVDILATGTMTLIYWWIFWHVFTEPGHMLGGSYWGEFDFPDPTQWTDKELGIPPDDYEG